MEGVYKFDIKEPYINGKHTQIKFGTPHQFALVHPVKIFKICKFPNKKNFKSTKPEPCNKPTNISRLNT